MDRSTAPATLNDSAGHVIDIPSIAADERTIADTITETIDSFVEHYCTFGKNAATHTIKKFAILVTAQTSLGDRFGEFCSRVRLDPKSGTFRKKMLIGRRADVLLPIAHLLPPNWTTIYRIAQLSTEQRERLLSLNTLHSEISAKDLTAATANDGCSQTDNTQDKGRSIRAADRQILSIDVSALAPENRIELSLKLNPILVEFGVCLSDHPLQLPCEPAPHDRLRDSSLDYCPRP
ncbi:hypothetical protein ACVILH_001837 [Bradyrhizobium sp. USDA 4353]